MSLTNSVISSTASLGGLVLFQVGGDDDLPLHGEAVDGGRALGRIEPGDAGQLHQPGLGRGDHQAADFLRFFAERQIGPQPDVVLLVEFLVLGDRLAAHQHVERGGDGLHGDAQVGGPLAVDIHAQLGLAQATGWYRRRGSLACVSSSSS